MKLVSRGVKPLPYWCGTWRCPQCQSVYEVSLEDAENVKYDDDQRDGESLHAHCEVCQSKTWLRRQGDKWTR